MQASTIKTCHESLTFEGNSINVSLLNFWQWSDSDLLSNALRGRLAEFIVATAIGVDLNKPRNEWVEYDLLTPEGVNIEIKSAA